MKLRFATGIALLATMNTFCAVVAVSVASAKLPENLNVGHVIKLTAPRLVGKMTLEEALAKRRSIREFTGRQLTLSELSQLLWACQGVTDKQRGLRSAPSAGALYPLEVYVVTKEGVFHYKPDRHELKVIRTGDIRKKLAGAALGQSAVSDAPCVFVITAVFERTERKYGVRAERYVHMEAGHACQNLLLQAVALGLSAVPIGAFDDSAVSRVLSLPKHHAPLYLIPLGR